MELPEIVRHAPYRRRRFLNWFPLGLAYALLYMARYNLTVAKGALGDLMTKEDFGLIFGAGTVVYAFAFLINGPLTDRVGGRRVMLVALAGSLVANLLMALFVHWRVSDPAWAGVSLVGPLATLYAVNMYFQSFGAVAIVKVNAHWFHVRERGGFSGVFGTMIASGIFFAFTINGLLIEWSRLFGDGSPLPWVVFLVPAVLLGIIWAVLFVILRDRPGLAGHEDFDTGEDRRTEGENVGTIELIRRILTHPVIFTVALIEFCTGVLRNGVMHWFPIYAKEVWALPQAHPLVNGAWERWDLLVGLWIGAALAFTLAARGAPLGRIEPGRARALWISLGATMAMLPFLQGGWGGLLFVAGVLGGNAAGWLSDWFFQSRRAPAAGLAYLLLTVACGGMAFSLGGTTTTVAWSDPRKQSELHPGDVIVAVGGVRELPDWSAVARAVACVPSRCEGTGVVWDAATCMCSSHPQDARPDLPPSSGHFDIRVRRDGQEKLLSIRDPLTVARAGDKRTLAAGPVLTISPYWLAVFVFFISAGVIAAHGLLSGTVTMDFGGRKGAATAVGMIDGFVYLGTALQSVALGYITSTNWAFWPWFLLPFAAAGFLLLLRIWHAVPRGKGGGGH